VRPLALLVLCLLGGFLTRSSTLFTLIAIVIGMVVVFGSSRARVQLSSRNKITTLAALVVVAGIGLLLVTRAPDLASGLRFETRTSVATRSNFLRFDLLSMFRAPYRPNLVNEAFPVTYMEIWGDWIGAFAWNPFSSAPTQKALAVLKDQVWIGVLPTLLALAGWLALAQRAIRRRPELAALAALPLVAVAGYLLRSYQLMSADGDLLKASYLLTTAPVWALGFGSAFVAVGRYRRVQLVLGACLVVFAVLELRFTMYGVRDSLPIF
jgi:FtsH-binding integral membrane protein